ncbi:MAG: hypothetical protein LBF97_08400, partial [Elusimicrobiota bacterium]|nr:hypothetical protein [Elusimicrobiota bacterium]
MSFKFNKYNENYLSDSFRDKLIFKPSKKSIKYKELDLNEKANILMKQNIDNEDKQNQLITFIHKDLNFRRNSINLMIGKRGSGKTYNVVREVIKL